MHTLRSLRGDFGKFSIADDALSSLRSEGWIRFERGDVVSEHLYFWKNFGGAVVIVHVVPVLEGVKPKPLQELSDV